MTKEINIALGRVRQDILVTAPGVFDGHVKLTMPEFYGRSGDHRFGIHQSMELANNGDDGQAEFALDRPAAQVGIDYRGSMAVREPNVLHLEACVCNGQAVDLQEAHHTFHLDTSTMPAFDDPAGERTFVYTNEGWTSLAQLLKVQADPPTCVWVGATYGELTIIWRTVARTSADGSLTMAFALDRGYAMASNHPDWPQGLLAGYRWGTLAPDEEKLLRGRLYFCAGGLDELRHRYARDFRHD